MLSKARGLVQSIVRGAVRLGMKAQEVYWTLKDQAVSYPEGEVFADYSKFARQDHISDEISTINQDQLIPGNLHEESLWKLSQKYRYEIATPWETVKGETFDIFTTVTSNIRLTPNEIYDIAVVHPSQSPPEKEGFYGEMEIVGSWAREGL